jgi:hypothetical protein
MHAGPLAGDAGIDAADAPVCDGAAQDHGMEKIVARKIVDELAATAKKAEILDPFDRAADKGVAHCFVAVADAPHPSRRELTRTPRDGAGPMLFVATFI